MEVAFVDDDYAQRLLVKSYFEQEGHHVEVFSQPSHLERAKRGLDVIISDGHMGGGLDWSATLNFANLYHKGVPFIVYSANRDTVHELQAAGILALEKTGDIRPLYDLATTVGSIHKLERQGDTDSS